ncbi:flagellar basal body L-ring protein FlgH [Vibrio genomosp. F10]|uniref:Flagellar L-ring protein n=2 Tax=Vibrio genomosp. F10 TaxID=723171 RepID=A0A1B9QX43_9VIBR|nr:flagellar basal body L-ring protein FlgH [Vibrio genomosp. F10]OCH74477.1 flagellar basal body L-ring protein [Vibrio genomosp. F10]OEE31775.1 flagellar basal body L-ring protein [Vibrio genomosp. F10 str. ZF-129]OEE92864.1 flagellar basal body L-ring protein [Vibrio genomosp. F10 str. 9ZD137]OEE96922.1 flagellar basal body L-ring protein [Vibrio genomosp. F10 str. 9ZC157]OEF09193.1 flagellar basal body L-ring protein [Vibrio genomosp. F10 str. 9ZB36]
MNRILFVLTILMMSGCTMLESPLETTDVVQGTTTIDAVEGDQSAEESSGLVDTLRGRNDPLAGDPAWAPIHPKQPPEHYAAETGSLFNLNTVSSLYDDSKPRGIGDIITVNLDESTKAAKSADADLAKNNDASMDPLEVGGQPLNIGDYDFSYNLSNDNKFSGSAAANQSNSISGSITVEVIEVLANGNLIIRGEKWLTLNTGDEYIRLSGTIRPDDIDFDNTIASNRISNARIQYSGTGTNQDMQEPGFLARFFNVSL